MKKIVFIFIGLFAITSFTACKTGRNAQETPKVLPAFRLNDTTSIALGDILIAANDHDFFVQFDTVYNDSRCPVDASCIWEGNAAVGFSVTYKKEMEKITVNTHQSRQQSAEVFGYRVRLTGLSPHPGTPNFNQTQPVAKFIVNSLKN